MGKIARFKIIYIEEQVPGIKIFRMEPVEGKIPPYKPGQFAVLHLLDDKGASMLKRPYSIASIPGMPYLEFCIKNVQGKMTSALDKFAVGATLGIELPFGHFTYSGEKSISMIAGGCGISPLIGILREIAEKGVNGRFVLFYSAKTRNSIIYRKELEELARRNKDIKVVLTLTQESPEGWVGECGRINDEVIKKHIADPKVFDWWICGPLPMIKGLKDCILGLGADPKRIRAEGWG